jgi:hypothetical protein
MRGPDSSASIRTPHRDSSQPRADSDSIALWHLYGTLGELLCAVRFTAYGCALTLELTGEPILLQLEEDVETLVKKAARLECWLMTQGWLALSDD